MILYFLFFKCNLTSGPHSRLPLNRGHNPGPHPDTPFPSTFPLTTSREKMARDHPVTTTDGCHRGASMQYCVWLK